jgi:hypothetical protein
MSGLDALKRLRGPWVDTRGAERRSVRVASIDDVVRELDRIESAAMPEGEGLRVTGNWSAGQILEHLAITIERSMDGFARPPLSARSLPAGLAKLAAKAERTRVVEREKRLKAILLGAEMSPEGPSVADAGELEPPMQSWTAQAAARLRVAIRRVQDGHSMERASPTAGPMTRAEWLEFHLRHAELHMAFIVLGEWR